MQRLIIGANTATILLMMLVGYAGTLNPAEFPNLSNAGLIFPFFILLNLAFLIVWALFRLRNIWIPIAGFLLCLEPIRAYCPINIGQKNTDNTLKIISYNVQTFHEWDKDAAIHPISQYLNDQQADIVCIQEMAEGELKLKATLKQLRPAYPHIEVLKTGTGSVSLALLSRYPILNSRLIPIPSRGNLSAAFEVKINSDTVTIINNHLETVGFSIEEKTEFEQIVEGTTRGDSAKTASKMLYHKVAQASRLRSKQVKIVKEYIEAHQDKPLICCGDLNDDPLSYTRRTLGKLLTDCYIATATGPGWSYHPNRILVRIDNIFCSKHFQPVACKVDRRHKYSDHYPIICHLKRK